MSYFLEELQPAALWQHFQHFCDIGRPTFYEQNIRDFYQRFAQKNGLEHKIDQAGNLHIYKNAHPDSQSQKTVILQAHLDMVAQQEAGRGHDFIQQGLTLKIEGDWLTAEGTTLGADNGLGAAAIMAVLEDASLCHPPLHAILTIEEEVGMGGAKNLQAQDLQAAYMLNLDSEQSGEVFIGCAGGVDVNAFEKFSAKKLKKNEFAIFALELSALAGGHSGLDIASDNLSAAVVSAQLLAFVSHSIPLRLASIQCGTMRNAIARDSWMVLAVAKRDKKKFIKKINKFYQKISANLNSADQHFAIQCQALKYDKKLKFINAAASRQLIALLLALPHGVARTSCDAHIALQSSNNIGVVKLAEGKFSCQLLVRAMRDAYIKELAAKIGAVFDLAGMRAHCSGFYPSWTPQPQSPLLAIFQQAQQRLFAMPAEVKVMHAGLECGIIGSKNRDLQMLSFGPTILGAHSPSERVQISSVLPFWQLLLQVLQDLAVEQ